MTDQAATAESTRAVAIAWRRVLGEDPAPGISFLEAAGDSLLLLTMVFALESRIGRTLPLDAFTAEADAAEMARALDKVQRDDAGPAAARAVFLLPGARGDTPGLAGVRADCVVAAAMHMVAYPGWRAMVAGRLSMADIVKSALADIRTVTPTGPVTLIGYSLGVQVAGEAALALEDEGREVRRLIVIDLGTPRWHEGVSHVWTPPASLREAWWEVHRLRRRGMGAERVGMMLARAASLPAARRALRSAGGSAWLRRACANTGDVGYWTGHHLGQEIRFLEADVWAQGWQAPGRKLRAPISLIRTAAHRADAPEDLGWGELADRVDVTHVAGDHVSMLSAAHRGAVSAAVMDALARA